jgi:hypothetical protein
MAKYAILAQRSAFSSLERREKAKFTAEPCFDYVT